MKKIEGYQRWQKICRHGKHTSQEYFYK